MSTPSFRQSALRSSLALALSLATAWAGAAPQAQAASETTVHVLPRVVVTAKSQPASPVQHLPRVVVSGRSTAAPAPEQAALPQAQTVLIAKAQPRRG
ncbi:hypothetical protein HNP55_001233 [Paucibacter oligotrophus]|uniref:Uncharacterized protein n=1 Tax=Roseateles oligotrophus TaxID=1769250 RepID=A0A840L945_9BURK|nr:hypothetical protein [Roseateles oligotrophus]MBB4842718.1 hypothetical protein [Roseateles oligotrophus]